MYGLSLSKANDYNWYSIRFGNGRAHIEHSFNSKNGTIRASLIIEGDTNLFDRLERNQSIFGTPLAKLGGDLQWDGKSKAQHINVILCNQDVKNAAYQETQFAWFAGWTYVLKRIIDTYDVGTTAVPASNAPALPNKVSLPINPAKGKDTSVHKTVSTPLANRSAAGYAKIMDKLADYLGLDLDASRYQQNGEDYMCIWDSMKTVISEIREISLDPNYKAGIDALLYENAPSTEEQPVMDLLREIRHTKIDWPLMNHKVHGITYLLQILETMNKHGIKKAAYYLARCYGSGLIGLDANHKPFVLGPNTKLAVKLYKEALDGGYYQAALELGCIAMAVHKNKTAQSYFVIAQEHGISEAEIYLNYISNYPDRENVYENYHIECASNQSMLYNHSRCGCNCIEYMGHLYFIEFRDQFEAIAKLYRINISGGQKQLLLEFKPNSQMRQYYPLDREQIFSIARNRIFLPVGQPDMIVSMNLDGSDVRYMNDLKVKDTEIITRPYAFSDFMLYEKNDKQLYRYDYETGQSTKLIKYTGLITGVSEKEIIFDNKRVLKLDTLSRVGIQSIYPALKGKSEDDVILIDCTREIAYYRDRVKKKIIGTDKNGKIVDIWVLPRRHWSCDAHWRNYDSRCFNGRRWTGKIGDVSINAQAQVGIWEENAPISIPQMMVAYDRSGNTVIVHKDRQNPDERSGKYNYGLGHAMTQHMEIVLRNTEDAKCWNMALNMYRPGQFLELCQFP